MFSETCCQINDVAHTRWCLRIKEIEQRRSATQSEKMCFWKDIDSFKIICEFVLIPTESTWNFLETWHHDLAVQLDCFSAFWLRPSVEVQLKNNRDKIEKEIFENAVHFVLILSHIKIGYKTKRSNTTWYGRETDQQISKTG